MKRGFLMITKAIWKDMGFSHYSQTRMSYFFMKMRQGKSSPALYDFGPGTALELLPSIALSSAQAVINFKTKENAETLQLKNETTRKNIKSHCRLDYRLRLFDFSSHVLGPLQIFLGKRIPPLLYGQPFQ